MNEEKQKFYSTLIRIVLGGFIILGVLMADIRYSAEKSSQERLEIARRSGELSVRSEAARLGYGRYNGSDFVWNTNLFENISLAMDSVIRSERRTAQVANVCLRMAKSTLETGEILRNIESQRKD